MQYDCIIIGAGISGISFAHYMRQMGKEVLVLERKDIIGGQVQSVVSPQLSNYWREMGAHTCYNSYTHLLSIVQDVNSVSKIQPLGKGPYVLYAEGKIKKIISEISFIPLLFNGPKLFFTSQKGKTVKQYFGNIVGKSNYDKLFSHLFRAVLSQSADDYPAELFLKRRKGRFEDYPRKYTFTEGLSSIINSIVETDKIEVIKHCEVIDIIKDGDSSYNIKTLDGKTFNASRIAFATDPQTTARLIRDLQPQVANILATIPLFRSESINILVAKEKLAIENVAGIIPISDEFHSAVSRDLVEDPKIRSFTFHFEKGEKSEDEKLDLICKVLNISKQDILESTQTPHILPSLRLDHVNIKQQIEQSLDDKNIHILGNYFYGLSLEDCIHRSHDESMRYK